MVTLTVLPRSPAVTLLIQTVDVFVLAVVVDTCVHPVIPAGAVQPSLLALVKNSTMVSPTWAAAGTVTLLDLADPSPEWTDPT